MTTCAFLFPGQGSQAVGMLADFATQDVVRNTFAEASEALGYDLWQVTQDGPADTLGSTEVTQPALLTAGVALWRLWQEKGGALPAFLAGHSLGEYTALVCAGVLSLADGVKLVRARGQYMQQAVPAGTGAMAAILKLDDDQVRAICAEAAQGEVVDAVNFNAPGQVVIAGGKAAVERAIDGVKAAGGRAMPLPVSVPSHCALMKPAAEKLQSELDKVTFNAPQIPVINNVDVVAETDPARIRDALIRQLYSPVRWVETVQHLAAQGVSRGVECGPGKVLTGLVKRIEKELEVLPLESAASFEQALQGE